MSTPKFTPGPWTAHLTDNLTEEPTGSFEIWGDNNRLVLVHHSDALGKARAEPEANARLIAAAPDLYEAEAENAKDARAGLDCLPRVDAIKDAVNAGDLDDLRDALAGVAEALHAIEHRARAALAKAGGKS